jgi:exonuclease SbcC
VRIKALKLNNFCQHKNLDIQFNPGVVGILGANGKGKSNLTKAIYRALTGETGNIGKKEDDLTRGETKGTIELWFHSNGHDGYIRRSLASAKGKMTYGEQEWNTATEIEQHMSELIGVTPDTLKRQIFVQQGAIEQIIFQRASDRKEALQLLFGLDRTEGIREALSEEISTIIIGSQAATIETLVKQQKEAQESLREAESTLAKLGTKRSHTEIEHLNLKIQEYLKNESTRSSIENLTESIRKDELAIAEIKAEMKDLSNTLADYELEMEDFCFKAGEARNIISRAEETNKKYKRKEDLFARLQVAESVLGTPPPTCSVTKKDLSALVDKYMEISSRLAISRKVMAAAEKDHTCPTCQQELSPLHIDKHLSEVKLLEPMGTTMKAEMDRMESELSSHTRLYSKWESDCKNAEKDCVHIMEEFEQLADVMPVSNEVIEQCKNVLEAFNTFEQTRNKVANAFEVATNKLKFHEGHRKDSQEYLKAQIASQKEVMSHSEFENAKAIVSDWGQFSAIISSLEGKCELLTKQIEQYQLAIDKLKYEEQALDSKKRYRNLLEGAKSLLHRDQLPRLVSQSYIKALNVHLAHYLEKFSSPFVAAFQEDFSVKCILPGGFEEAAERLSGGQKVMLGLAFRFAVYQMFVGHFGLMVLDEPTTFLDHDNVENVCGVLESVRGYSRSAGLQLIVVTHEPRLASVCDQVITL